MASLQQIFGWFARGLFPTQDQYKQTFSSFWHRSERLPQTQIVGLNDSLKKLEDEKVNRDDLINLGVGIKGYGDDVQNVADLQAVPDKYEGLAVVVINDKDENGNSYLWLYDGSKWNRTPYTTFPKDVLKEKDIEPLNAQYNASVYPYFQTSNITGIVWSLGDGKKVDLSDIIKNITLIIKSPTLRYKADGTERCFIISAIGKNPDQNNKPRYVIVAEGDNGSFETGSAIRIYDAVTTDTNIEAVHKQETEDFYFYSIINPDNFDFWVGRVGYSDSKFPAETTLIDVSEQKLIKRSEYSLLQNTYHKNIEVFNDFFAKSYTPILKESNFLPLSSGIVVGNAGNSFDLNKVFNSITIESNNPYKNDGRLQKFIVSAVGKHPTKGYRLVIVGQGDDDGYQTPNDVPQGNAFYLYDSKYNTERLSDIDTRIVLNGRTYMLKVSFNWEYAEANWVGGIALIDSKNTSENVLIDASGKYEKNVYVKNISNIEYVDPRDYGAIYDGLTDCAPAINMALSTGKKIVFIGNGIALCKDTLIISKDGTSLNLDNGFTIKLADQTNKPLVATIGAQYKYNDPLVYTKVVRNVSIKGGALDFNGANQTRDFANKTYVGFGMQIADASNFKFENSKMINPNSFGFQGGGLHGFVIKNIVCQYDNLRPNMDGIHINGDSLDGVIENITGTTNDDMVALNAVDGEEYMLRKGNIRRITIRDVKCYYNGYRGIRLLNDNTQILDEINIDGVFGEYRYDGVLVSSYRGVPAKLGRINISNILCYSLNSALVYIQNGGAICEVESLNISKLNYKQRAGKIIPIVKLEGKIGVLSINDATLQTDDIDLSGLSLINGSGNIDNVMLNNLIVDAPVSKARTKDLIKTNFKSLLINNSIIRTTNMYNLQSNGSYIKEGNVLFDGNNKIVDNGYSYTLE